MQKYLIGVIPVALLALAGCSSTQEVSTTPESAVVAVGKEKVQEREMIKVELARLDRQTSSILAAAQGNESCGAYRRYKEYAHLAYRSKEAGMGNNIPELTTSLTASAQHASDLGYQDMVAGKPMVCGVGEGRINGAEMVTNFAQLADEYGSSKEGVKFNPNVFRTAYIRAIKPEVQDALAEVQKPEYEEDGTGPLYHLLQDAQEWHITPAELGVPPAIVKKLNL